MAYMSQERKAQIAPVVKSIFKKYGVKGTLSVRNHMTLALKIKSGKIDFINNFVETTGTTDRWVADKRSIDVNIYWYQDHFTGKAREFLREVITAMNAGNHDNSDIQTDYFDVGWYVDVNIGNWKQPYVVV